MSGVRRALLGGLLPAAALLALAPVPSAAPLPPTVAAGPLQDDAPPERRSLEDLLAEARAAREARQAELLPRVTETIQALDALERRSRERRAEAAIDTLVELGPDAAPLLVQFIDAGAAGSRAQMYRAECVTRALQRLAAVSVTDALVEKARSGSIAGRLNALEALCAAPDGDRVAPFLAELSRAPEPSDEGGVPRAVKLAALGALARVGGPTAERILAETLASDDRDAAANALEALAMTRQAAAAPQVLSLMRAREGSALAKEIAGYLDAVPEALALDDAVDATIELILRDTVSRDGRVALLDVLRFAGERPPAEYKRELGALTDILDGEVRRAALLYLASARDRGARRTLLEPYDLRIREERNLGRTYEQRAETLHAIADYAAAARDWREALKIQSDQGGVRSSDPYLGLARSLAAMGRFKEAAEYLEQAPVSMSVLHALAKERDFEEMLTSRYRDAFHLPDDEGDQR